MGLLRKWSIRRYIMYVLFPNTLSEMSRDHGLLMTADIVWSRLHNHIHSPPDLGESQLLRDAL